MDFVSLLITFIGIIVLLGLFIMSRLYDQTPVRQSDKSIKIPTFTDSNGEELSSVKADFPAPLTQTPRYPNNQHTASDNKPKSPEKGESKQLILFIASQSPQQLDGNKIISAMRENQLTLGKNDIYHYLIDHDKSLFSIANGISPWTLRESDLIDQTLPGLSMVMQMPTLIDSSDAINIFVETGKKLAKAVNGELQNTQQQIFLDTDKKAMLKAID